MVLTSAAAARKSILNLLGSVFPVRPAEKKPRSKFLGVGASVRPDDQK